MDITEKIINTAFEKFNIVSVKPYQLLVMQRIVEQEYGLYEKKDLIVILPTGTGKSLCFLVPSLLCRGITIIVYPLLSLMNDQINKLNFHHIGYIVLKGNQSDEERKVSFNLIKEQKVKIVITNPETLNQKKIIKELAKFKISLFVCDEAHVIAKWGPSFRPEYLKLKETIKILCPKQILAFTATASDISINIIKENLFENEVQIVKADSDRENIIYNSYRCSSKLFGLIALLGSCQKPALVFCKTRNLTRKLCFESKRILKNINTMYYNAGLSQHERENIEAWFMDCTDGVLFATCAYGLGVDKQNIRTVIHYNLPSDVEEFLQESGRAGRDNQDAFSYVLVSENDVLNAYSDDLLKIFVSSECRRSSLLSLMGQQKNECTGCDVCNKQVHIAVDTNIITSLVNKYPFRFSTDDLVSLLIGEDEKYSLNIYFGVFRSYDKTLIYECVNNIFGIKIAKVQNRLYPLGKRLYTLIAKGFKFYKWGI